MTGHIRCRGKTYCTVMLGVNVIVLLRQRNICKSCASQDRYHSIRISPCSKDVRYISSKVPSFQSSDHVHREETEVATLTTPASSSRGSDRGE
jgi:hypothetical protein